MRVPPTRSNIAASRPPRFRIRFLKFEMADVSSITQLVLRLSEIGAVKFGEFKLKTGVISPIYFDLRVVVSFPDVLRLVVDLIWERLQSSSTRCDFVCGVPYTALPVASVLSAQHDVCGDLY